MSLFFNTSGLITRGLGEAAKILTRGFGADKIVKGLPPKVDRVKEYVIDLISPVKKESFFEIDIFIPIKVIISKYILIKSNITKEVFKNIDFKTRVNSKKLFNIIDAI